MGIFEKLIYTVETLYSTIYYSKYFIELNIDKSTQYVALWTHKRHPIPRPSYGVSFMSTSTEIDRVIKGFYCIRAQQTPKPESPRHEKLPVGHVDFAKFSSAFFTFYITGI